MNKNMLYRSIPKVDILLEEEEIKGADLTLQQRDGYGSCAYRDG